MCPKCNIPLGPDSSGLARCEQCGGVWLDAETIRKGELDERVRGRLQQLWAQLDGFSYSSRYACPDCSDQAMAMGRVGEVEVEWCRNCRGIFLDFGEWPRVQSGPKSEPVSGVAFNVVEAGSWSLEIVADLLGSVLDL